MGKIAERNREIFERYEDGTSAGELSSEYGLSEKTIVHIVSVTKQRSKDFGEDKLLTDADDNKRALDEIRKIQDGDIVKVRHDTIDAEGRKCQKIFTGTVIYTDNMMITVRGEHYAESFNLVDLTQELVEHIPS